MKERYRYSLVILSGAVSALSLFRAVGVFDTGFVEETSRDYANGGFLGFSTLTKKLEWKDETFRVYSVTKQSLNNVRGKKSGLATVFVTESGHVWAGPEPEFYIETKSEVLGGEVWGRDVIWIPSEIHRDRSGLADVEAVLKRFEKEKNIGIGLRLLPLRTRWGIRTIGRGLAVQDGLSETAEFHYHYRLAREPDAVLLSGDTVRLKLCEGNNPPNATLWIDVNSKKLLKAVEGDKVVFDRWKTTTLYGVGFVFATWATAVLLWQRKRSNNLDGKPGRK
ncbi:MAG: hypothetical protein WC740_16935 [Verrucomicrobiia bacterium]